MVKLPFLLLALGFLALGGMASTAQAQEVSAASLESDRRQGLFIGGSFGRGSIEVQCSSECYDNATLTEALSLQGHVGFMLTPALAVVGEHWTVRYNQRGGPLFDDTAPHLVAQHMSTVGGQVFVGSFWLRTGLGVGWHISDGDYNKRHPERTPPLVSNVDDKGGRAPSGSENLDGASGSFYAAIGWEFAANDFFAADIQLRTATTHRPDEAYVIRNVGINVGASWF